MDELGCFDGTRDGKVDGAGNLEMKSSCGSSGSGARISKCVLLFFRGAVSLKSGGPGGILGMERSDGAFGGSFDGLFDGAGVGVEGRSAGPGVFDRGKKTGGCRKSMVMR